jgi:NAD(P)-dependent dehydrogenase (short-subunit alcohol dehydrogenase family)
MNHPPPNVMVMGATGTLGRALVSAFADAGWSVTAGWHKSPPPSEFRNISCSQMDVTDLKSLRLGIGQHVARWGRLDALVNAAGIAPEGLLLQHSAGDWDQALQVNLTGSLLCAQAAFEVMQKQRDGHLLLIGSHAGKTGASGLSAYATAKAALHGLTQDLARETGPDGIRVNAVLPGVLESAMTRNVSPRQREAWTQANHLRQLNQPGEVARFIVFLAGMRQVSGQLFQLDSRPGLVF